MKILYGDVLDTGFKDGFDHCIDILRHFKTGKMPFPRQKR